jgi:serine protease
MARTLRFLFALLAMVVLVFVLVPKGAVRVKPEPIAATVPDAPGRLVVDLQDDASEADLIAIEAVLGADLDWTSPLSRDEGLIEGDVADLDDAVALLAGHPLVEFAEPALVMEAFGFPDGPPNDPMYAKQWHLDAMGAPVGWADTPRGEGVVVAVVDTGVAKVEDLAGTKLLAGASFVPGAATSNDDNGHGTHCAGTIAQATNNGVGVAGVAPAATILPVKVLSGGGMGSSSWIASGIDYAVDQGADVISLSLGGGYSLVIHNAIKKATDKGVIVVAAAGNSGREGVSYPGALNETIGVSATGPGGALAPYSSWGKGVDIAAPGGDKTKPGGGVWQDTIDGKGGHHYAEYQGTSMATPHVAGAAAILLSTGMEPDAVERALLDSARGPGAWDPKFGYGQLDLGAALGQVIDRHASIRFGLAATLALLVLQLAGISNTFRFISAVTAGTMAGGLFFLAWLPLPQGWIVDLLSRGVLLWPAVLGGSTWVNFPLWLSAGLPMLAAFTFGAFRKTRPLALGVACGIGAHLIHGAATGTLNPWWMPGGLDVLWLSANGIGCLLLALGLAGAEKIDSEARR